MGIIDSAIGKATSFAIGTAAKTVGKTALGVFDAFGGRSLTSKFLERSRSGLRYSAARLGTETAKVAGLAAGKGAVNLLRDAPATVRFADRFAFNKPKDAGFLERTPKPWLSGSVALIALLSGLNMGNQVAAASRTEYNPRTDPTMLPDNEMPYHKMRPRKEENPIMMQDATHNRKNMGATGDLTIALHKNRHG